MQNRIGLSFLISLVALPLACSPESTDSSGSTVPVMSSPIATVLAGTQPIVSGSQQPTASPDSSAVTSSEPVNPGPQVPTPVVPVPVTAAPTATSVDVEDDTSNMGEGGAGGATDPAESDTVDVAPTDAMTEPDAMTLPDETTATDNMTAMDDAGVAPGGSNPSPGCMSSGRPNNGTVYVEGESWLVFPESYDGNTPFPVLWGFHGCGTGNRGDATRTEYTDATRNTPFQSEYVVAIPISSDAGGCWNYNTDIARVRNLYDDLVNNYCVDMDRMFATGHSSGAYFAVALLQADHAADAEHLNLRGMAPVAASPVNNHSTPMPVLYMENPSDTERGDDNAPTVVAGYRNANGCADTNQPYEMVESCNSSSGGAQVDPGCVIYDGCAYPTIWCSHNDQSYGTTGHGIPCFAAQAMDDFFKSL